MRNHILGKAFLLPAILAACDATIVDPVAEDNVVIEAFIFAGEPVTDIRLTTAVPLSDTNSVIPTIDDALVELFREGSTYRLDATGDGYYAYGGNDLVVAEGDLFRLEVTYFGKVASAETVVPGRPIDVAVDENTLVVPTFGRGGGGADLARLQVVATWSNPDILLHYVVVEGPENATDQIFPAQIQERIARFRIVTEPTLDPFHIVTLLQLRDIGTHTIRVYRVNAEYSDLYENRTQDSRDLNEPPSNVQGGLGVFSAFNSGTVQFEVVRN